jgi:hypothetical protein
MYMGQPTQYAAADGARLSILSILDMSQKPRRSASPRTRSSRSTLPCAG